MVLFSVSSIMREHWDLVSATRCSGSGPIRPGVLTSARWIVSAALLFGMVLQSHADRSSNWRMFKQTDGLFETYAASVTASPLGNIWVKHGEAAQISILDGYRIRTLPSPGRDNFRVYESRTGQLWSLYPLGLAFYGGEEWAYHPVTEIQTELEADPLRQLRQLPLLPADHHHVLFLLPDRLMEYDASTRRTTPLKHVSETRLGKFLELGDARDGGLWITGAKGALKYPGPLRHLRPSTPAQEFTIDESWHVENLQRPFEDAAGAITMVASDNRSPGRRVLLRFNAGAWSVRPVESASVRQAWTAWDHSTWAYAHNSLLRFDQAPLGSYTREKIWAGQYLDVATETNDVFWLATSEGLLRYAPYIWRTPVELEDINGHVHAIVPEDQDRFWFASTDSLFHYHAGQVTSNKWPETLEADFETRDSLYRLNDGRLAVGVGARSFQFDPKSGQFKLLSHPSGRLVRFLGQLPDRKVVVQLLRAQPGAGHGFELELFDGERFEPFLTAPPDSPIGPELSFVTSLRNGEVWIGGIGGVARWRDGSVERFGHAQGLREGQARCLAEVGDGKVWCGSSGAIVEFNGKNWSTVRAGFDRINAILRGPDNRIWVATADGLFSYTNGSWVQHGMEEGLSGPGISTLFVDDHHQLWAGATRGLSRFHPEADISPPKTLPPMLEDVSNGKITGDKATILLNGIDKWQQTPGARLLFSTRLDEGQWSPYSSSMTKSLEHLGGGRHHLEVRAMDRNWNEDPDFAALDFSVVLAWYDDPRLIVVWFVVLCLAGFAVNRHLRLTRSYAEVERMVAVRTHELQQANEELLQSRKMKALGALAAGIAHDFNNILSIIKGSAQIIESNLGDRQKVLTRLARIQAVVEQGSGIVKSILGLSRVQPKDQVQTDVNGLVAEFIRLTGDRFLQEVTVQFRPASSLPQVALVKELVQQMLLNLILNAADAMDRKGEILVRTGLWHDLPSNLALSPAWAARYVYITVQDAGSGIEPEVLPRIFEPFFTTKALSARRGTGLGLSIVYEIARHMGYGLEVRTIPGEGSTFSILLPLREPGAES